jgi:hypothetical protein
MDRNFLYAVAVFLGIAIGGVYTQKKNPEFFASWTNGKTQVESWRKEDPGWTKDNLPNSGPSVAPPVTPVEPRVEPEPTPPPTQPQPKTQPRRLQPRQQPQNECPPNG